MLCVFVKDHRLQETLCFQAPLCSTTDHLWEIINSKCGHVDCFISRNGKKVDSSEKLESDATYHIIPRMCGGKGGFGSMLRALGAQIEKTTNHEACRDLSGRRMRDVNNEKKLKDWISKKAELEREREEKRRQKRAKILQQPLHKFEDNTYHEQKSKVSENLQDALSQGLKKNYQNGGRKRKAESTVTTKGKRTAAWLGYGDLSNSDSDSVSSGSNPASPCSPPSMESDAAHDIHPGVTASDTPSTSKDGDSSPDSSGCGLAYKDSKDSDSVGTRTENDFAKVLCENTEKGVQNAGGSTFVEAGKEEGRKDEESDNLKTDEHNTKINLEDYSSASELECLGLERLKSALMARGLKCGGTLQQRAERLYSVKGLAPHHISKALLAKPPKAKK